MSKKNELRSSSPTIELLRATAKRKVYRVVQAINDGAELAVNKHGHNALHIASYKGFLDIVKILLSAGCEVDVQDDNGDTALHLACINGHDLVVKRLIQEGCSVDRQNQLGDAALHEAASRGFSRCVKALIFGRANIGLKNKVSLPLAKLNAPQPNSDTAIHLASANSHSGSLRLLLSSFSARSVQNNQGDTPLHIAVRYGHTTCARVLISAKCNINIQNKLGNTPLHIAAIARHHKLVGILQDAGACLKSVRNRDKKTALDLARDNNHGEIAVMLTAGPHQKNGLKSRGRRCKRFGTKARRSKSESRLEESRQTESPVIKKHEQADLGDHRERPKSATLPRKQYLMQKKLRAHDHRRSVSKAKSGDILEAQQRSLTVNPFVVPQLYSLYRDCQGNVQQRPVVDQLPNPTSEVVSTLANAVADSKGELLEEMRKTNCMLEKRLDELEHNTSLRVTKLDLVTKERIHAERTRCLHRIDRRAMAERAILSCQNTGCDRLEQDESECAKQLASATNAKTNHKKPNAASRSLQICERYVACSAASEPINVPITCAERKNIADNFSDSAYSSLRPKSCGESTDTAGRRSHAPSPAHSNHINNAQGWRCDTGSKWKPLCQEIIHDSDGGRGRVSQQIFENVACSMEDWYERRLREITRKQQADMNRKVAELEGKVKSLEMSQGRCEPRDSVANGLPDSS